VFRTDSKISWLPHVVLSSILFVALFAAYFWGSYRRHVENPQDKLMPSISQLMNGVNNVAFEKDREGKLRLWIDTWASMKRFGVALAIVFCGAILGLNMGVFPIWEAIFYRFLVFFDKIPALSLLPILFIVFGLGELSKVALIVIGVFPTVALDAYLRAKDIPKELIYKAQTLGATEQEICYRVVLPWIFPRILETIRLNLKSMILLLIAGESLAASVGLGYRIFVVRRYLAMDIIIPYVLWMTILLFALDLAFQYWKRWRYPWTQAV
jgi:NitT/TauT family transport system permease protein